MLPTRSLTKFWSLIHEAAHISNTLADCTRHRHLAGCAGTFILGVQMNWLSKAAPYLVTALTGKVPALAAMAAKDIAGVLGVDETVEAVTEALNAGNVSPEQIATIKKLDSDFKIRMAELGYKSILDLESIAAGDRANAREREIKTGDWTPKVLTILVTFGFFGVLAFLLENGKPEHGGDALLVMLGALGSAWGAVVNYYYGSSSGSAQKQKVLERFQSSK